MADKLTPKQEKFVQGLFSGLSQRQAFKQAYKSENMKDKTMDKKACEIAAQSNIKGRLTELQDELKNRNMVTVERVLAEYAKIGFADIKDFIEYKTVKTVVDTEDNGELIIDYKMVVDAKDSSEIDGTLINEVSIGKDGTFKLKLHDKLNALEKMGKTLGMFIERVEANNKNENVNQDISMFAPEERKKRIQELRNKLGEGE